MAFDCRQTFEFLRHYGDVEVGLAGVQALHRRMSSVFAGLVHYVKAAASYLLEHVEL